MAIQSKRAAGVRRDKDKAVRRKRNKNVRKRSVGRMEGKAVRGGRRDIRVKAVWRGSNGKAQTICQPRRSVRLGIKQAATAVLACGKSRHGSILKIQKAKTLRCAEMRKEYGAGTVVRKAEQTDVLAYKKRHRHGNALGALTASATAWGRAVPRKSDTIRLLCASAHPPFPPLSAGGFFARLRQARLLAAQWSATARAPRR